MTLQKMVQIVYGALCHLIGTPEQVASRREIVDMMELFVNLRKYCKHKTMVSGSIKEGFRLKDSDADFMFWLDDHRVIWDFSQSEFYNIHRQALILCDSSESPSGFTLLWLPLDRAASNVIYKVDSIKFCAFLSNESSSDFMLQYAVKGEYTNFRGAWLNDTHFLVAKRFFTDRTHFKLEAHEVKLTSKNKKRNLKKLFKKCKNKGKGVLVTHSFPSRNDFIRVIDPRKWGDLRQYHPNLDEVEMELLGSDNSQPGGGQTKQQQGKPDTDSSERESEDEQLDGENSKSDGHQVDEDSSDEDDLSDEDELTESDIESAMREPMLYYKMVRSTWFKKNRWQQTRKHVPPMKDESSRPYPQVLRQIQSQGGKIVTMVRDSDCGEKFEIAFFSVNDDEEVCAAPFKVLKVDAKIIGLRVSHDQR
ncbi:uncharacterized protein [Magallana gigas]|uniref:uncharacterized protein n=1 Tax=Magallana gigas TaxID=29159 RepID=UPI00333E5D85